MLRLGVWVALAGCVSAQTGFCSGNADAQAEPDVACGNGYGALCLPACLPVCLCLRYSALRRSVLSPSP